MYFVYCLQLIIKHHSNNINLVLTSVVTVPIAAVMTLWFHPDKPCGTLIGKRGWKHGWIGVEIEAMSTS